MKFKDMRKRTRTKIKLRPGMVLRAVIPKWLAEKEKIPRFLRGYIKAETEKAIKIHGSWIPKSQIETIVEGDGYVKDGNKILCSLCGSEMVLKKKGGERFYGCTNYPACNNAIFNHHCKKCGAFIEETNIELCSSCFDGTFGCPICGSRLNLDNGTVRGIGIPTVMPSDRVRACRWPSWLNLPDLCPKCDVKEAETYLLERRKKLSPECEICGVKLLPDYGGLSWKKKQQEGSKKFLDEDYPIKISHHISYEPEKTISVCPTCHQKIHKSDEFPELKPEK